MYVLKWTMKNNHGEQYLRRVTPGDMSGANPDTYQSVALDRATQFGTLQEILDWAYARATHKFGGLGPVSLVEVREVKPTPKFEEVRVVI